MRGQIVLLNDGGGNCNRGAQGLCKSRMWSDNTDEDNWTPDCNPYRNSCEQYLLSLKNNMMDANWGAKKSPEQQQFYFTFTSASSGKHLAGPKIYAKIVNPDVKKFVTNFETPAALGFVIMDFMDDKMSRVIYGKNFAN